MIVGLTGGIGSGKSTVASVFNQLGVPVYEADLWARNLIDRDDIQSALVELMGEGILSSGVIDRKKMASLIFNDKALLARVNGLIHPAVATHFKNWYREQQSPYVIREAAILFESGSYKDCDKVIVVHAPLEMRIQRVMERNGISREEVMERVNNQWPEEDKLRLADYVVYNDLSRSVIKQSISIHEDIIRQSDP